MVYPVVGLLWIPLWERFYDYFTLYYYYYSSHWPLIYYLALLFGLFGSDSLSASTPNLGAHWGTDASTLQCREAIHHGHLLPGPASFRRKELDKSSWSGSGISDAGGPCDVTCCRPIDRIKGLKFFFLIPANLNILSSGFISLASPFWFITHSQGRGGPAILFYIKSPELFLLLLLFLYIIFSPISLQLFCFNPSNLLRNHLDVSCSQDANNPELKELLMDSPLSQVGFFLIYCFITPMLEEAVYRGFLLTSLAATAMKWPSAVAISALAFSSAHFSAENFLQLFLIGCVLGSAFCWSGSLTASFAIHSVYNAIILLVACSSGK